MKANPNYIFLKQSVPTQKVTLLQGGTRSGKTYSVIYYIIDLCRKYSGLEIDLVRDTFTALKATAWKDFKDVLIDLQLYDIRNHNRSDHFYILNGNTISYYGADDPKKIHGRARDILWVNEAHQFPEDTIDQLFPRTRHKIICDYNPAIGVEHWLDPYIEKHPPLITTYKDNPHLTQSQIEEIEIRMARSEYYRKVYGNGERAPREGVIFEGWIEGEFDTMIPYCYAMDYGFNPDPLGLIKVAVDNKHKKIYLEEKAYLTNLSTESVKDVILNAIDKPSDLVVCDTNEPRTTNELREARVNIQPAKKNKIVDDIRAMESYQIIVCGSSPNLKMELNNYIWNDKKASIPVDEYNHLIDPARYGFNRLRYKASSGSTVIKRK